MAGQAGGRRCPLREERARGSQVYSRHAPASANGSPSALWISATTVHCIVVTSLRSWKASSARVGVQTGGDEGLRRSTWSLSTRAENTVLESIGRVLLEVQPSAAIPAGSWCWHEAIAGVVCQLSEECPTRCYPRWATNVATRVDHKWSKHQVTICFNRFRSGELPWENSARKSDISWEMPR